MENKISFGTDGIRGNASYHPFTHNSLKRLGYAIGQWLLKKESSLQPSILIAGDTRESFTRIKEDLVEGLSLHAQVVEAGILPTPAIALLLNKSRTFQAGIVISASHNPYHDNGIKLFDHCGEKISEQDEAIIIDEYYAATLSEKSQKSFAKEIWPYACKNYQNEILRHFADYNLNNLSVVLDCAHGATAQSAPYIFKQLGASVHIIGAEPNGLNINSNCGALHLGPLKEKVKALKADIGFAFDGDGDRLMVVNRYGETKDGDDILFILSSSSWYQSAQKIVGTIMSNQGLENSLLSLNKQLIRTPVGDKYVQRTLKEKNLFLGGETSGHIIMHDYLSTGDGIFAALRLLVVLQKTGNLEMETFQKFPQAMINLPIKQKKNLLEEPFLSLIQEYKLKLLNGRILVRFSGTENLLRVMAEAEHYNLAHTTAQELAFQLETLLS